jgi:hypothetical protein
MAVPAMSEVRVALPWVEDALVAVRDTGSSREFPALAWLIGRGRRISNPVGGWREWLVADRSAALASLERSTAGPCAAVVAGLDPAAAPAWALAQPVHLAAGVDHLRLAPLAAATPDDAEGAALAETFDAHFGPHGYTIAARLPHGWVLRCHESLDCTTHDPLAAVGRDVHDFMPAGPQGSKVRSLINETQMLWHEHPVNEQRTRRRALPVNSLWPWGFGSSAPENSGVTLPTLLADDAWLLGWWQANGGKAGAVDAVGSDPVAVGTRIAVSRPGNVDAAGSLAHVDAAVLAPLRRAFERGLVGDLRLRTGSREFALDRHARWRFWRGPASLTAAFP